MKSTIKVRAITKAQVDQYSLLVSAVNDGYARFEELFGPKPELLDLRHVMSMSANDASVEYENAVIRAAGYAQSMIGTICRLLKLKTDVLLGPPENWKDWGCDSKETWSPIFVIEDETGNRTVYPASTSYLVTKRYLLLQLFMRLSNFYGGTINV